MYNKQIILDYLVENNVKVSEHTDAKIFDSAESIKELLESNEIEKLITTHLYSLNMSFILVGII